MILTQHLILKGFSLSEVKVQDFVDYQIIHRACYEKYVDEYFGGWVDDVQLKMQTDEYNNARTRSCHKKILLFGETVGFFTFDELVDRIDGVSIQMINKAQNLGMGSFYSNHIITLSITNNKPILLQVFKSNPAKNLYRRYGFEVYDETFSHYKMKYTPIIK
jgi:ribosomal protein S18 acetylase RimI-like enzyme